MARILAQGAAAILAGGHGRRMGGVEKSQLVVGGQTILKRQLAVLQQRFSPIYYVTKRGAQEPDAPVVRLEDRVADVGPLGGLEAVLAHDAGPHVLVVGCDMPRIELEVIDALMAAPPALAVVVRAPSGVHPLFGRYHVHLLDEVRRRIAQGELAMMDLIAAAEARYVEVATPVLNVNSPADLAAASQALGI